MASGSTKIRLDEILVNEGLVGEPEVKEALERQKDHGGRFGSQLLECGYIDEEKLVKALSLQLECESVVLSQYEIPDIILSMIPGRIARARKVMPFDYDTENDVLKIACIDPTDKKLRDELSFIARGKKVKLYVAADTVLNDTISECYPVREGESDPESGQPESAPPERTEVHVAAGAAVGDIWIQNLELLTSLLSSQAGLPVNHGGRVGRYVYRLCRRLDLPEKERLLITDAAYMHDLSRYYYQTDGNRDNRRVIPLTVKLLTSLNYNEQVIDILRQMYVSVQGQNADTPPPAVLGGNILTLVDLFCESVLRHERITLDKFDAVESKLRTEIGRLFLADVVEAFAEMIKEEIFQAGPLGPAWQVMLYSGDEIRHRILEMRLKSEGFRTVTHDSPRELFDLYQRSEPDIIVLVVPGPVEQVNSFISVLSQGDVIFEKTPTFLMVEPGTVAGLTGLLERGIEDIIPLDDNLEILIAKILQLKDQLNLEKTGKVNSAQSAETTG